MGFTIQNHLRKYDISPLASWDLLGSPCGLAIHAMDFCEKISLDVGKIRRIKQIPDPQVVYTLLRNCAGQCQANHLARTVGPMPCFSRLDDEVMEAFDLAVGPLCPGPSAPFPLAQCRLPFRRGGVGLRPLSRVAAVAFFASLGSSVRYRRYLSAPKPPPSDNDWALFNALSDSCLAIPTLRSSIDDHLRDTVHDV